jgi:hypothetical protein
VNLHEGKTTMRLPGHLVVAELPQHPVVIIGAGSARLFAAKALRRGARRATPPPGRRDDRWVTAGPGHLIAAVALRHREWQYFAPMIPAIKKGEDVTGLEMKPLTAGVLALKCLPRPEAGVALTRPAALARVSPAPR